MVGRPKRGHDSPITSSRSISCFTEVVKKLSFLLIGCCLIVPSTLLFARLGDTELQITQRYGNPIAKAQDKDPRQKTRSYQYQGFEISVVFLDDRSRVEVFRRDAFSASQIQTLLNANSLTWQKASESSWSAEQGQLLAVFDRFGFPPSLSIGSAQFMDYLAQRKALAEKPF
jgi:hypothetical protein